MFKRLSIVGWLVAAVLGAWTLYELIRQPSDPTPKLTTKSPKVTSVDLPALEFVPPELEDLKITLDRPLFNASRRPEESASVTAGSQTDPPGSVNQANQANQAPPLRLSAVIVDEQGRSALLEPVETRVVQRVREGENIAGWRLVEVREDAVVLAEGGKRTELALRVFEAPPPVRAPQRTRKTPVKRDRRPKRKPEARRLRDQATKRSTKNRAARNELARGASN